MFSAISGNVVRGAVLCDRCCGGTADRRCSCAAEAEKRNLGVAALLSVREKENFMLSYRLRQTALAD
jgi:hypothetical protein